MLFRTVIALLVASATAFTASKPVFVRPLPQLHLMSQEETESIMSKAQDCVNSECSIDEVDDLISVLKSTEKDLQHRLKQVVDMIHTLDKVNNKDDDRSVDEIRETVRALFRVFQLGDKASGNDYPSLSKPTGWSGDVGKGPTTAYDALPPKQMKKATP